MIYSVAGTVSSGVDMWAVSKPISHVTCGDRAELRLEISPATTTPSLLYFNPYPVQSTYSKS